MSELISVIVPVYNIESYLDRSICSLQAQTYKNLQIVLVDDGSQDASGTIIDAYALNNTNIISIHKLNSGVTETRIRGVETASGDYIGFCDGDDEVEPEMYERLYANLVKYNADISHCGHQVHRPGKPVEYIHNTGRLAVQDTHEGLKDLISGSFEPGLWSKLFRKTLLHSLLHSGKMDYSIKINEDLLMNYYLFRSARKSVYEDICPYYYYKREGSASRSGLNQHQIFDPISVKKRILVDCVGTDEEQIAKQALLSTYLNVINRLTLTNSTDFKKEKTIIRNEMRELLPECCILGAKRSMFYRLSLTAPHIYKLIYSVYSRVNP